MAIKIWKCDYESHIIEFVNEWTWEGYSREELLIDGKSVVLQEKDLNSGTPMKDMIGEKISYELDDGTTIEILAGSAWHLFGVAVKILANGKYIGGDKIVLFAKKK